jgi:hypothetical protein
MKTKVVLFFVFWIWIGLFLTMTKAIRGNEISESICPNSNIIEKNPPCTELIKTDKNKDLSLLIFLDKDEYGINDEFSFKVVLRNTSGNPIKVLDRMKVMNLSSDFEGELYLRFFGEGISQKYYENQGQEAFHKVFEKTKMINVLDNLTYEFSIPVESLIIADTNRSTKGIIQAVYVGKKIPLDNDPLWEGFLYSNVVSFILRGSE